MGRRDRTPSPPPASRRPGPSYRFDSYEDGKAKWAPKTDDEQDPRDVRREHRPRRERYGDAAPPPPKESRPRRRRAYSSSGSESDVPSKPPRRSHIQRERRPRDPYDSYDEQPPRRQPDDRRRDREYGYASDNRHNRPRRDVSYDDRDRRDRPRDDRDRPRDDRDRDRGGRDRKDRHRDDRYDDMFRDSRRDPRRDPRRDDRDRRGRHSDDEYGRDVGRRRGKSVGREPEWQKQAVHLFKQYALPVIKAEGGKYLSKQAAGFMSKR